MIEDQFRRRGPRHLRFADAPLSTSPLDGLIEPIRGPLHPRRYGLENRERSNWLLLLMQLHADRQDDMPAYAKHIRVWMEADHGRPSVAPRAVTDRRSSPSLR